MAIGEDDRGSDDERRVTTAVEVMKIPSTIVRVHFRFCRLFGSVSGLG
ncbi:hypothetical protein Hdeb2414_s0009g00312681 [Helianthus debilis subsp. tardiflorus]